jgi:LysM repeat protein
MKRFSLLLTFALLAPLLAPAQDAATEDQLNRLRAEVSALQTANVALQKSMSDVLKELQELRTQGSAPRTEYASAADAKQLAEAIKEVDRKREADRDLILAELKKLAKTPAAPVVADRPPSAERGYEYVVQSGDTLSAIVTAYRDQGVKVTVNDVLKANAGLKAENLKVGQKIFIPHPTR